MQTLQRTIALAISTNFRRMVGILPDLHIDGELQSVGLEGEELSVAVVFVWDDGVVETVALGVEEHEEVVLLDERVDGSEDADFGVVGWVAPGSKCRGEVLEFLLHYGAVGVGCDVISIQLLVVEERVSRKCRR